MSLIVRKWCKQTQLAKNNWCLQKSGKGKMMSRGLMTTLNGTPTEVEGTVWGCKPPAQPFWMSIMVADVKVLIVINGSRVFAEKNYSAPFFDR